MGVKGTRLNKQGRSCMPAGRPAVRGLQKISADAYATTPACAVC